MKTPLKLPGGGPAFPLDNMAAAHLISLINISGEAIADEEYIRLLKLGMSGATLRDWFAAEALPGVCALMASDMHRPKLGEPQDGAEFIAYSAYKLADAMLKARSA